ncbi:hypothetical protein OMCYN_00850 [cyanobiont of Ornithocercus magnificus]|nr:hypothetical protein OMCYN_00850 [cyanobiont of Ornithocercus magnificus]
MYPLRKAISHRVHNYLWQQGGTAGQRARGLGAGVFCGCFPLFGFQIIFSIVVANLLRGNRLLAAAGTLVSNPFTYIPLYWFNYRVGEALTGSKSLPDLDTISIDKFWRIGWIFSSRLFLGSSVVAVTASISLGLVAYVLFRRNSAAVVRPH